MVMTTSEASTASVVSTFGRWSEMSMPTSAMACDGCRVDLVAGERAGRADLDGVAGQVAQPAGGHLASGRRCARRRTGRWVVGTGAPLGHGWAAGRAAVRRAGARTRTSMSSRMARTSPRPSAGGVAHLPVEVALAGVDGAGVAAAHGHDDVGGAHDVVGERLRETGGEVDARARPWRRPRRRRWPRPAGSRRSGRATRPSPCSCEQAGGHLGAAGVVHAARTAPRGPRWRRHPWTAAQGGEPLGGEAAGQRRAGARVTRAVRARAV